MTDQAGDGGQYEYPMPKIDGVELVSDGPIKFPINVDYTQPVTLTHLPTTTFASLFDTWGGIQTSSTTVTSAVMGYYPPYSPGLSWAEVAEKQAWDAKLLERESAEKQREQQRLQARQRRLERRKLRLGRHPKQPVARQPIDLGLEEPS